MSLRKSPRLTPEFLAAVRRDAQLSTRPRTALLTFPYRGRVGKKEGTRELVLSSLPYVAVYRVSGEAIHIVRILHGAQKRP
ncbi:MAG: type II toxin-antitoxin system RelE/ParE family toxin [Terriglobia bacterium]